MGRWEPRFGRTPQPPLVMTVDFAGFETFEIRIYDQDRARTLVAVVELVSPGNKDRPENSRAFLDGISPPRCREGAVRRGRRYCHLAPARSTPR